MKTNAFRGHGAMLGAMLATLGTAACIDFPAPGDPTEPGDPADPAVDTARIAPRVSVALQNGWVNAPFSTRNVGVFFDPSSGITHFSGAVGSGSSSVVFTLPPLYRPSVTTYIPVDLCGATNGRLIIQPDGTTSVQAETSFANAQCFTSLEGASYASTTAGFSGLTLQNGWISDPPGTSLAVFGSLGGAIRFKGAISSGTTGVAFTLPAGFRPATNVYVPVDLCNATNGRLFIQPSGVATVQAEGGNFASAQCFTSLDGAWFVPDTTGATFLTLQNGWTNAPFGTSAAAVKNVAGIVHFKGAIASGTSDVAFTLPAGLAPTANTYVPVDLCNATKGRLLIQPSGVVSVQAEGGNFANAQCFTSLDGASYSIAGF